MNRLTCDLIAIDTSIFEHLLNPAHNKGGHIHALFSKLIDDEIKLLVDSAHRITGEYNDRFDDDRLKKIDDDEANTRLFLLYWLDPKNHHPIEINQGGELMKAIKGIVPKREGVDKCFVYVALHEGRVLITNDRRHIIDERNAKGKRRRKLLGIPENKGKKDGADILTSQEVYSKL